MNFREYFMGMTPSDREAYAQRAGTSVNYILVGFASVKDGKPPRKIPKPDLLRRLVDASEGKVAMAEALAYFGFATLDELRIYFDMEGAASIAALLDHHDGMAADTELPPDAVVADAVAPSAI